MRKDQGVVTSIHTILTANTGHLHQGRGGVSSLSSVYYWVKGQNVHVVNSHQLISSMVKWSRAILQCSQAAKQ